MRLNNALRPNDLVGPHFLPLETSASALYNATKNLTTRKCTRFALVLVVLILTSGPKDKERAEQDRQEKCRTLVKTHVLIMSKLGGRATSIPRWPLDENNRVEMYLALKPFLGFPEQT